MTNEDSGNATLEFIPIHVYQDGEFFKAHIRRSLVLFVSDIDKRGVEDTEVGSMIVYDFEELPIYVKESQETIMDFLRLE